MSNFKIDDRNKVKRVPARGHYDEETLYKILDSAFLCHIAFNLNHQPFIIPTLYGRKDNYIYIHGASTSRMLQEMQKDIPVCLSVTHVDALVLARSAFHHSMNYRSAVVYGTAKLVEGDEKYDGLKVVSENILKGRWDEVREPSEKEMKATTVLKLEIEQASSKIRQGPPGDDKADYELPIWAGLVEFETRIKAVIPDPLLKEGIDLPESVKNIDTEY